MIYQEMRHHVKIYHKGRKELKKFFASFVVFYMLSKCL